MSLFSATVMELVGMCLVIRRFTNTISDLVFLVDDVQWQPNAYASKHEYSPLPSEWVDGDALFATSVCYFVENK